MIVAARVCAALAGVIAAVALLGYATGTRSLILVRSGLQGMSPVTASVLLMLVGAALAAASKRNRLVSGLGGCAAALATAILVDHVVIGADTISPWLGTGMFGVTAEAVGRTSIATALGVLSLAAALIWRVRSPLAADIAGGAGLVLSGMALLGYFYGVGDLYALPMFNSIALNTATALFLLSISALFVEPETGWAGVIGSGEIGGGATRRQLCFIALPIVAGWVLLAATRNAQVGPAVAMALLVIVTIVPLAILVLRDGRVLNALDRERRQRVTMQESASADMAQQLSRQADELAHEGEERAKAEAAMYRAQRMEAVGQLTGGIAHDFNNLLMAIRGNLELLHHRLPDGDERLRRHVANATAATDKGAKITAQLLAFSRSQRLDIRSVELDPVLASARELIGNALGPGIDLIVALDAPQAWVATDPDQLELAILNLAVNARDAMPEGGRIRIESAACADRLAGEDDTDSYVAIRVIDDGSGMTPEVASQAMEPFFTTKELGKGTGLGLAQVYGFVRQCGGDLRIVSAPGAGTTVEILLRCSEPETMTVMPTGHTSAAGSKPTATGQKILVIDDDDGVRAVIVDALVTAGFKVVEAADGESGIALLETHAPAAAVIDFLMPGLNGAEVARIAQRRLPGLPIVFVSGYSDTLALDGITGATVLRKPFDIDGLNRAVMAALN